MSDSVIPTATGVTVADVLPYEAVLMLRRAASTPIPPGDRMARTKAIDHAVRTVRLKYPQYFKAHGPTSSV